MIVGWLVVGDEPSVPKLFTGWAMCSISTSHIFYSKWPICMWWSLWSALICPIWAICSRRAMWYQDGLCAPYRCVRQIKCSIVSVIYPWAMYTRLYLTVIYPWTMFTRLYLTVIYLWAMYTRRMSYVLSIDISHGYLPRISHIYETDELCAPYQWVLSHGYLPRMCHMYETDELCAPYRWVLRLMIICLGCAVCMRWAMPSTVIYPKWATCSILVVLVSYGYLPNMSYVLHMDMLNSWWLFTQRLGCVLHMDVSISRWLFA